MRKGGRSKLYRAPPSGSARFSSCFKLRGSIPFLVVPKQPFVNHRHPSTLYGPETSCVVLCRLRCAPVTDILSFNFPSSGLLNHNKIAILLCHWFLGPCVN